jgi:hypothetical protein
MPVLKKPKCCPHRDPSVVSAESLGLDLIEARRLYDTWREHPGWSARRITYAADVKRVSDRQLVGACYVQTNRAKWMRFCGQAVEKGRFVPRSYHFEDDRPLESVQQSKFMKRCRALGWMAYKAEAPGMAGLPDVQVLRPGLSGKVKDRATLAFVEMKRPDETPTKLQLHVIRKLQLMGFTAFWSDDPREAFERLCALWGVSR